MPVDKRKVTIKTLLVAVAMPLTVFGLQMVLNGQTIRGGTALGLGVVATGVFVAFQEYDVPYEDEIRGVLESAEITTEDVIGLSEAISEQVEERVDRAGDGRDGA